VVIVGSGPFQAATGVSGTRRSSGMTASLASSLGTDAARAKATTNESAIASMTIECFDSCICSSVGIIEMRDFNKIEPMSGEVS